MPAASNTTHHLGYDKCRRLLRVISRNQIDCDVGQAAQDDAATVFIQGDRDSYGQPMHSPRFERISPSTLFGHEYITSIIDEGHILRNINLAHTAARALQGKSHSTVIMTATPVTTKPAVSQP
jgi:hypothetical protein